MKLGGCGHDGAGPFAVFGLCADEPGGVDFLAGEAERILLLEAVGMVGREDQRTRGEGYVMLGEAVVPVGEVMLLGAGVAVFPGLLHGADHEGEFEREAVALLPAPLDAEVAVAELCLDLFSIDAGLAGGGPSGIVDREGEGAAAL